MATRSYTIVSHNPQEREVTADSIPDVDPWQACATPLHAAAPRFVPSTIPFDEWGSRNHHSSSTNNDIGPRTDVADWYKSVTSQASSSVRKSASLPPIAQTPGESGKRKYERRNKNNWFIMNAIQSEPSSPNTPTPTLADLLARDPPQSSGSFQPPVFLTLGPSNKGFSMLQQHGWNEGEGLGPHAVRRGRASPDIMQTEPKPPMQTTSVHSKQKEKQARHGFRSENSDVQKLDVIDLTISDDDGTAADIDGNLDDNMSTSKNPGEDNSTMSSAPQEPYSQKVLLTPIPTILKSDRLGIGLKAKTEGPYKSSRKRVTHNAAALSAHVRTAEEIRKMKKQVGQGRRGFAKIEKREREKRQQLLAYLNE